MANACISEYKLYGNKGMINQLFSKFEKIFHADRSEHADRKGTYLPMPWLGYVVKEILELDPERDDIYCRGIISYIDEKVTNCDDDTAFFQIQTETAWVPMNGVFKLIEEKFGIEVFYIAEELAMGIFEGNDTEGRFFTDRYILDDTELDMDYFDSFDDLASVINDLIGEKPKTFDDIQGIISKHELDERIMVYEIEYVSLSD